MELKAKDLRIGNWVTLIKQNIYENKDYQLDAYDIYKASEFDDITECLLPIPLTEEWLIKFGFEVEKKIGNRDRFNVYKKGCLTFNTSHQRWWLSGIHSPFNPKYVHQLQNLYHSLTGQELQIIK